MRAEDAEFIVWARNHTDEIKAALQRDSTWRQGYDQGRAVTRAEREQQRRRAEKAEAERDRLCATVQRIREMVEPDACPQGTVFASAIRATLNVGLEHNCSARSSPPVICPTCLNGGE